MERNIANELAGLDRLSAPELRHQSATLVGEPTWGANRVWLVKRLAWRMQALAEGDLSERARRRAAELANDADLRLGPPRLQKNGSKAPAPPPSAARRDRRLPPPGTLLTPAHKGQTPQGPGPADGLEF